MFWKLFKIIIFYVIITNFSLSSCSSNFKSYECILGAKTPYRCVANNDDAELKYSGILKYIHIFHS